MINYTPHNQSNRWNRHTLMIMLAKAFLILVVCLTVGNNSCGNSSSSKFSLLILYIVFVLFFAGDFNLFNWVFVSLTLDSW